MRPDECRFQLTGQSGDPWNTEILQPRITVSWNGLGAPATMSNHQGVLQTWGNPLDALAFIDGNRRFYGHDGRWIGYLSYDLGRIFEVMPSHALDDTRWPWFAFGFCCHADNALPADAADTSRHEIDGNAPSIISTFTRPQYLAACRRVLDYIGAGDIFQANLSQRFTITPAGQSPWSIHRRLRRATPASYGGCLQFGTRALVSNSPELFLRVDPDRRVVTRPIKGTRPVGPGMAEALRDSIKDQAELNMIIDLERNDLGRVCRAGSVKVTSPRDIESHPTVHHGVATIEGRLREDISFVDLLAATFPGGSITGTPKIRAMEIIDELEPVRRGPYCGAIGYLDSNGSAQFNIAIRTMLMMDGQIHISVGGGIVADSDPQAEYEETLVKARAMFAAVGIREEDAIGAVDIAARPSMHPPRIS